MYDTITNTDNPHELLPNDAAARLWRERLAAGLPMYSADRYIDLTSHEKRLARGEFMAFRTGPYARRVEMLTAFDAIAATLGHDFPDALAASDPVDFGDDAINL